MITNHSFKSEVRRLFGSIAIAACILFLQNAQAQLMTEAFDYGNAAGTSLNGIGGWTAAAQATIQDGNLTYGALTAPVVLNDKKVRLSNANGLHSRTFNASAIGSGSVYVSFLLKLTTLHTTDGYFWPVLCLDNDASINLNSGTGFRQARAGLVVYCRRVSSTTYQLGIRKNENSAATGTTTWDSATFTTADTVLVVGKYSFGPGAGDDTVTLWVNPTSLGGAEDGSPAVPATTSSNTSDSQPIQHVVLVSASNGNGGGIAELDDIRVGQNWSEVTPAGPPPLGTKLVFTTPPANTVAGLTITPAVVVRIQDIGGNNAPSNGVPVTLTLTSGSGTLNGTLTQNTDANGKATFSNLSIDTTGAGKLLTANASGIGAGLTDATSDPFNITAPPVGTKLGFTTQPANTLAGATMNVVIVQVQEPGRASVASNNVPITLTLTSGSGALNGTLTQNTDASGKATFNNLSIDTAGAGKQFTANASGIGAGLTDATSNPFTITAPPVGTKLGFTTNPANTLAGAIMNSVVVQVQEPGGAAMPSNNVPVTLNLTSGSGTLSGTTTRNTDSSGKATFNDLSIDAAGTGKQFTASASGIGAGLTDATSGLFSITTPPVVARPVITQTLKTVSSVILRGTNGTPDGNYSVLSTTNVALSLSLWPAIATNSFDGNGNFDCTNPVSPADLRRFFSLLVIAEPPPLDNGPDGFATVGMDITGGGDTTNIVTATNLAQFGAAVSNGTPCIIYVEGTITLSSANNVYVRPNKTIIGVGTNATLIGCLAFYNTAQGGFSSNCIVRNVHVTNPDAYGEDDGIVIKSGAHHIWVDHCTFFDIADGALDVTREADYVTVSWCKFYYTTVNSHDDTVNLIGGSDGDDTDSDDLHVTFHHNWYGQNCLQRQPSVRYGRVHVYNNYYNSPGNMYCVRTRLYAQILAENNYFNQVNDPFEQYINPNTGTEPASAHGLLKATGNIMENCTTNYTYIITGGPRNHNPGTLVSSNATSITFNQDGDTYTIVNVVPGNDTLSELNPPPYPYTLDIASSIPNLVTNYAGAGKGPFAP